MQSAVPLPKSAVMKLRNMESTKIKQSIVKETVQTSRLKTNSIIQTIKHYLTYVVLAVVIATAFFIHEGFSPIPDEFYQAKANWQAAKSEYNNALDKLKDLNAQLYNGSITTEEFSTRQYALFDDYTKANKKKNDLHEIATEIQSEAKFLHFKSFQFFLGEIGWASGLFLYALVNLFNTFYLKTRYVKREFAGKILLHSTLLFIGCFYTFYVFYSKKDFSPIWYFLAMALCSVTLVIASKYITDSYIKRTEYLRENIQKLIAFIHRVKNKYYKKVAMEAMYAEEKDVILDRDESAEENHNEFEDDYYKTLFRLNL